MFKQNLCDLCGNCLVECQWIEATRDQSIEWMNDMIAGKQTPVLNRCITCFACNELCPQNANPFDLIATLQEKYHTFLSREVAETEEAKYIFSRELKDYPRADQVMTTCVFQKTHDHLIKGELYDLPRVDGKPYNCWMLFSHWGAQSVHHRHIAELVERLAMTGAKKVICFHDDCYNTLAVLAPEIGIEIPFRLIHLSEYLAEYLYVNKKRIKSLDIDIAYQRPCASRFTPEKEHFVDELFELAGVRRVERSYDREKALCCASIQLLLQNGDPRPAQEKNILDAQNNGAQAMVCLCPMCSNNLSEVATAHNMPLIFLGDIARMALGEIEVPFNQSNRD